MGQYALSHTRNIRRETNDWTGGHIYMQTDRAELGNVTASSQLCPSHSFPVNVSRTQQSWGSLSDRLCTCYISSDRNNLLPAQALQAAWDLKAKRESTEKGTEGKKKRFSEQMQVSRKYCWNCCLSILLGISISVFQCPLKMYRNSQIPVLTQTHRGTEFRKGKTLDII